MTVQQTSSQEVNLRRDATAATEGHSFHAAGVAFHQQSNGVESGRLRPGGYLTSLGLGLPKDQLLLPKGYPACGTTPCRRSLTRRTGLLGKSRLVTTIASPCIPECAVTDLTGPAWIPGCRTIAIRQTDCPAFGSPSCWKRCNLNISSLYVKKTSK